MINKNKQVAVKKRAPGYLLYIGDEIVSNYMVDYFINHYKDPYESTSIMESKRVFFVAQVAVITELVYPMTQLKCKYFD